MFHSLYKITSNFFASRATSYLQKRVEQGKEEPERLNERYGIASCPRPSGTLVWVHAASVGEARSVIALIHTLLSKHLSWHILVTTGTVSSARIITEELPENAIHQYLPLDVPSWVTSFLDHWRPDTVVWVEQEIWPNMLGEIHRRQIPAILANGRLTESSFKRWSWIKSMARGLLAPFKVIYAQSPYDGERFKALSGRDVVVNGNLKYGAEPLPYKPVLLDQLQKHIGDRPIWLAASTHLGEEFIIAEAHKLILTEKPRTLLVIVPRHPDRGDQISNDMVQSGLSLARRSYHDHIHETTQVYLADTFSELGLFFRLCPVAFIGGSLVRVGGHNLIEPAQLGCMVLYGPHMENFQEIKEQFETNQVSTQIHTPEELAQNVVELLNNSEKRKSIQKKLEKMIQQEGKVLEDLIKDIETALGDAEKPQ